MSPPATPPIPLSALISDLIDAKHHERVIKRASAPDAFCASAEQAVADIRAQIDAAYPAAVTPPLVTPCAMFTSMDDY